MPVQEVSTHDSIESSRASASERRLDQLLAWVTWLVGQANAAPRRTSSIQRRLSQPIIEPADFFDGGIHTLVRRRPEPRA